MRAVGVRQDGFTLVETLVALSMFLLVLVGLFQMFDTSHALSLTVQHKQDVQQNGRVAMDTLVRQIRMAGYFPENLDTDPANDQANPTQLATNSVLVVAGDLDGSGATSTFLFCVDASGLRRVKGAIGVATSYQCANGDILSESVTALAFTYYDATGTPVPNPPTAPVVLDAQDVGAVPSFVNTAQRGTVRQVVITLTARENVPGHPPQQYTLTSDVRFRNP